MSCQFRICSSFRCTIAMSRSAVGRDLRCDRMIVRPSCAAHRWFRCRHHDMRSHRRPQLRCLWAFIFPARRSWPVTSSDCLGRGVRARGVSVQCARHTRRRLCEAHQTRRCNAALSCLRPLLRTPSAEPGAPGDARLAAIRRSHASPSASPPAIGIPLAQRTPDSCSVTPAGALPWTPPIVSTALPSSPRNIRCPCQSSA